jgi:cell division septum initiation protein DivIVA
VASDPEPVNASGAFEVVRRGYARDQVDAQLHELERRVLAAENARRMAEQHAASMAEELRLLRAGTSAEGLPATPQSFGFRAEKVVRLAEREAADTRAAAQRDADALREAAMREVGEIQAAARREAAEIRAAGTREAAELMERAHADAAQARADAAAERSAVAASREQSAALREQVEREGAQVRDLRGAVRGELARLHALLGAQLQGLSQPARSAEPPTGLLPVVEGETGVVVEEAVGGPVWTPTPGTADLFDTPPRPAPRVPEPRAESAENRHSLRSG